MPAERLAALRGRLADNKRRLMRLQAWGAPPLRACLHAVAARNEEAEATFLANAAGGGPDADVWCQEAERWLRLHVDAQLAELEQCVDLEDGHGGSRGPTVVRRRRHSLV